MATTQDRPRRADAERNIARIIAAARQQLSADPAASTDDIARAAGVGRMTLYGHFRTRAELVEAALVEGLRLAEETFSTLELDGDPPTALARLLSTSWALLDESTSLVAAADGVVSDQRLLELHEKPAERVERIVRRGQQLGAFRADLPVRWLVSAIHFILHGAAEEVRAGRLRTQQAPDVVVKTVLSMLQCRPRQGAIN